MNPRCPRCGGTMIGDGYKTVLHCENSTEESYFYADPDRGPIYCDMNQTNEQLAEQCVRKLAARHNVEYNRKTILSAIQSATQPLVQRVEELEAHQAKLIGTNAALTEALSTGTCSECQTSDPLHCDDCNNVIQLTARVKELENEIELRKSGAKLNELILTAKIDDAELRKDKERLDWLQMGHCVYAICTPEHPQGYEFEIDGFQDAPRSASLRQVIDQSRNHSTQGTENQ
jgi:hypothetical protein